MIIVFPMVSLEVKKHGFVFLLCVFSLSSSPSFFPSPFLLPLLLLTSCPSLLGHLWARGDSEQLRCLQRQGEAALWTSCHNQWWMGLPRADASQC